jgi:rRNA N6-adenosine-methyltransferase METTL5
MKLKQLESILSGVESFPKPKVDLEQVSTSSHIAARMIFAAIEYDDIVSQFVGDFGVGTGMLSIACAAAGAISVTGFDCDQDALDIAQKNIENLDIHEVELVQVDISSLNLAQLPSGYPNFDTVVMNPPFGTRNTGIDSEFVLKGMNSASVVYSLHKTSTRDYFVKLAESNGYGFEVLAELRYELPKVHKFHKQKSKDIEVDLYRFWHKS